MSETKCLVCETPVVDGEDCPQCGYPWDARATVLALIAERDDFKAEAERLRIENILANTRASIVDEARLQRISELLASTFDLEQQLAAKEKEAQESWRDHGLSKFNSGNRITALETENLSLRAELSEARALLKAAQECRKCGGRMAEKPMCDDCADEIEFGKRP